MKGNSITKRIVSLTCAVSLIAMGVPLPSRATEIPIPPSQTDVPATALNITEPVSREWIYGDIVALEAAVEPEGSTDAVQWSSDADTVVAIDKDSGEAVAKGVGRAIITAEAGSEKATLELTVKEKPIRVASVSLGAKVYDGTTVVDAGLFQGVAYEGLVGADDPGLSGLSFGALPEATAKAEGYEVAVDYTGAVLANPNYSLDGSGSVSFAKLKVIPRELAVVLTDASTAVVKESDGTKALTEKNKEDIRSRIQIQANSLISPDRAELDITVPDTLQYSTANVTDKTNRISLSGIEIRQASPENPNYTLDVSAVTGASLPASITAIVLEAGEATADTTRAKEATAVAHGVTLEAGVPGQDGTYWYGEKGVRVTLPADTSLLKTEGGAAVRSEGEERYLAVSNGEEFYICQKDAYYGPYQAIYQVDTQTPEVRLLSAVWADAARDRVSYRVSVGDKGSGVDQGSIQYGVSATENADDVADWQYATGRSVEFEATIGKDLYLFVKASDVVGNELEPTLLKPLALEADEPTAVVTIDSSYRQSHDIKVEAWDADAEGTAPYTYSGISSIGYVLQNQEGEVVYTLTESNPLVPGEEKDLPSVRTWTHSVTGLQKGNCGVYDGVLLDGAYALLVTVTDYCGNQYVAKQSDLHFDNTAPAYTVTMEEGKENEGDFYYREDNCGIRIQVEDERLADGVSYHVKAGSQEATGTVDISGVIEIPAADVALNEDGEQVISVALTDHAGNTNKLYQEADGIWGVRGSADRSSCSFLLDKTSPVVTGISSSAASTGFYEGDYYYKQGISVDFTIAEANPGTWQAFVQKDGEICGAEYSTVTREKVSFALEEDGCYADLQISGTDLAGNPLVLDGGLSAADGENGVAAIERGVRLVAPKIIDTKAPVARLTYTEIAGEHVYEEETKVYYNRDIQGKIQITDQYGDIGVKLDETKLFYQDTEEEAAAFGVAQGESVEKLFSWTTDGEYYLSVYGTDRAGNPLTVEEYNPHKGSKQTWENCDAADSFIPKFHVIRDTEAPVYTFEVVSAESQNQKQENGRYYFNKGFQTRLIVTEENYDPQRISVSRAYQALSEKTDTESVDLKDGFTFRVQEGEEKSFADAVSEGEGIYRYLIQGTDRAGNALTPALSQEDLVDSLAQTAGDEQADLSVHVILDTTPPKILVKTKDAEGDFYSGELSQDGYHQVNHPYRRQAKAEATVSVVDDTPASLSYSFASSNQGATNTNMKYQSSQMIRSHRQTTVFDGQQAVWLTRLEAADRAGNRVALGNGSGEISAYMYLDVEPPAYDAFAPNVNMKLSGNAGETAKGAVFGPGGNTLYSGDVKAEVKISDPRKEIKSSGLYKVYYKIEVNGQDVTAQNLALVTSRSGKVASGEITYGTSGHGAMVEGNQTLVYEDAVSFAFGTKDFNYNDVKLTVWAEDNSGNQNGKLSGSFGIDITKPSIRVRYDNNDVQNEKYFKEDRTAFIEVTERNFNEAKTWIRTESGAGVSGWSKTLGREANGDDTVWSCSVTYSVDGDYTFDVETTDLAGNAMEGGVDYGDSVAPREFTLDKTLPVIEITFDNNEVRNGKYYQEGRTATIEITEHNFSGEDAVVTPTASIAEGSVSVPGITGWRSEGDSNVTTLPFQSDGDYTLQVEYKDLAGNIAETKQVEEFTVDTTAPVIEIARVEDRSANQGEVAPSVIYHDINYAAGMTSVTITGYKNRDGRNLKGSAHEDAFGGSFICSNIEEIPENDDVYLCTGHVEDMAGNSSEAEIRFSVNRYGSNYILDEATEKLVADYYTGEPPAIQVTEINVNTLEFREITATLNGEILPLSEGADYQVTHQGSEDTWKEYHYTIPARYFREDGAYNLTIHSRDEAKNENSNRTALVAENAKPIDFVLDMTAPSVVISGVEEEGQYVEDSRTITVLAEDNIGLSKLNLYLDGELEASFSEEELAQSKGLITYEAQSKNKWQTLQVELLDKAGNPAKSDVRYLLTSNLWIQYIHNMPLVAGTVAGLVGLILLIMLIKRRGITGCLLVLFIEV